MANKYSLVFFITQYLGNIRRILLYGNELYVRTDTELQLYIAMVAILVMCPRSFV